MEREIIEDAILTAYITLTPEQRRAFESFLELVLMSYAWRTLISSHLQGFRWFRRVSKQQKIQQFTHAL